MAPLLVVTDLDGCLLDVETYAWEPAREALEALRERGVPVIPCTTKTRTELEALAAGARVRRPLDRGRGRGARRGGRRLHPALPGAAPARCSAKARRPPRWRARWRRSAAETGTALRGFSQMSLSELQALTGLSRAAAVRASDREFDEPFLLEDRPHALPALKAAAERRGLTLTRGARFFHLSGPADKGRALAELRQLYAGSGGAPPIVALGDAPADLGMLLAAERAIAGPAAGTASTPSSRARCPPRSARPRRGLWAGTARCCCCSKGRLPLVADEKRRRA